MGTICFLESNVCRAVNLTEIKSAIYVTSITSAQTGAVEIHFPIYFRKQSFP